MPKAIDERSRTEMRHLIIHAAAEEFSRVGFEQTRIDMIAERAGIGKGTIYLYFDSKQDLFKIMLQEIANEQLNVLKLALGNNRKLEDVLSILFSCFLRFSKEQPESMAIFISSLYGVNRQFKAEAAAQRLPFLKFIESVLEEAISNEDAKQEVQLTALFILNMFQSLPLLASALGYDNNYMQEHQAQIFNMLLWSLQKN